MTGFQLRNGAGTRIRKSPFCDLHWDTSSGSQETLKPSETLKRPHAGISKVPKQATFFQLFARHSEECCFSISTAENASSHGVMWSTSSSLGNLGGKSWI